MRMAMHIQYKISDSLKIHLPKIIKKIVKIWRSLTKTKNAPVFFESQCIFWLFHASASYAQRWLLWSALFTKSRHNNKIKNNRKKYISLCSIVPLSRSNIDLFAGRASPLHHAAVEASYDRAWSSSAVSIAVIETNINWWRRRNKCTIIDIYWAVTGLYITVYH